MDDINDKWPEEHSIDDLENIDEMERFFDTPQRAQAWKEKMVVNTVADIKREIAEKDGYFEAESTKNMCKAIISIAVCYFPMLILFAGISVYTAFPEFLSPIISAALTVAVFWRYIRKKCTDKDLKFSFICILIICVAFSCFLAAALFIS